LGHLEAVSVLTVPHALLCMVLLNCLVCLLQAAGKLLAGMR
jgi:hypothetical protein